MTSRKEPMIQWFFDSLHRECGGEYRGLKIVVVDYRADEPGRKDEFASLARAPITHVPPKPCSYQGRHRHTKEEYFAAANARNTAVCHAPDGWIAFVDDLSVLMHGWLRCVESAISGGYVVCGAYKKVKHMVVENGELVFHKEHVSGVDTRWNRGSPDGPVLLPSGSMYGCSVAMPVKALLDINGFDEACDCLGMGGEDYICGMMLEYAGYKIMYDRRMLTLESEERHHWDPPMKRVIENGYGDKDASWAILNQVRDGKRIKAPGQSMAAIRAHVLATGLYPDLELPETNWYSGKPLSDY